FQAEDGIRDFHVTGVQTCALPILFGGSNLIYGDSCSTYCYPCLQCSDNRTSNGTECRSSSPYGLHFLDSHHSNLTDFHGFHGIKIGRASCRESVWFVVGVVAVKRK